jgi:hypothetical protein
MRETGFSIWLGALCTTQAEAAERLGVTDRSVRRYKVGERKVSETMAKFMFVRAVEHFLPEVPIHSFPFDAWPDRPDDARALLRKLLEMERAFDAPSPDTEMGADTRTSSPRNSTNRTAGPLNSDTRTNGPHNSVMRTDGPLKSWFSRWLPTADPTG